MDYEYKEHYCTALLEHFGQPAGAWSTGDDKTKRRWEANPLPTFAGFAFKIGVPQTVLKDWAKIHPAWAQACAMAEEAQEDILIQNTLRGAYNNSFASFTAKNFMGSRNSPVAGNSAGLPADDDPARSPFELARRIAFILGTAELAPGTEAIKDLVADGEPDTMSNDAPNGIELEDDHTSN